MTTETNYTPAPATAQTETIEQRLARFNGKPDHGDKCQCAECQRFNALTPTQGEHTPLPWRVVPIGSQRYVESDAGFVCDMQRNSCENEAEIATSDANAAFIVKAVNNHERLEQQNQKLVAALKMVNPRDVPTVTRNAIAAALADAQGD